MTIKKLRDIDGEIVPKSDVMIFGWQKINELIDTVNGLDQFRKHLIKLRLEGLEERVEKLEKKHKTMITTVGGLNTGLNVVLERVEGLEKPDYYRLNAQQLYDTELKKRGMSRLDTPQEKPQFSSYRGAIEYIDKHDLYPNDELRERAKELLSQEKPSFRESIRSILYAVHQAGVDGVRPAAIVDASTKDTLNLVEEYYGGEQE